jgi:hypothetical protein
MAGVAATGELMSGCPPGEVRRDRPDVQRTVDVSQLERHSGSVEQARGWSGARRVFLAWEKLRVVYNAVLGLEVLILIPWLYGSYVPEAEGDMVDAATLWILVIEGAVIANICYFSGPLLESYVRWLGMRTPVVRVLLFVLGTLFTLLLALFSLATLGWEDF